MPQALSPVKAVISHKKDIDDALERLIIFSNQTFNIDSNQVNWNDVNYIKNLSELLSNTTDYAFREGLFSSQGDCNETIN